MELLFSYETRFYTHYEHTSNKLSNHIEITYELLFMGLRCLDIFFTILLCCVQNFRDKLQRRVTIQVNLIAFLINCIKHEHPVYSLCHSLLDNASASILSNIDSQATPLVLVHIIFCHGDSSSLW